MNPLRRVRNQSSDHRCSFCGKQQDEVEKLITGERGKICNECIGVASGIMDDDNPTPTLPPPSMPATPTVPTTA